ncbi:M4 family metallopeptidase [Porticoccaceae bacterium]|nr:M4 family metallopeptidase [Porticoccaceae bacterium]
MTKRIQYSVFALIVIALGWFVFSYNGSRLAETASDDHVNKTKAALINGRSSIVVSDTKQRRNVPGNVGTLSHDEAIRRVNNDLDKLSALVAPSKKAENRNNKLTNKQQSQLDGLEKRYSAKKPTKALFNKSNELVSLFPNLEITGLSELSTDLMATNIKSIVDDNPDLFGLNDIGVSDVRSECVASMCRTIIKKSFGGLPAWDHELVLATNKSQLFSVQGVFNAPDITRFTSERLSYSQIKGYISEHYKLDQTQLEFKTQPELGIARDNNRNFLAYKVEVNLGEYKIYDVYLDVDTKRVPKVVPLVYHAQVAASGVDLSGNQVEFQAEESGGNYYLKDNRFPLGYSTSVYSASDKTGFKGENPRSDVSFISSNSASGGWDSAAISALKNAKTLIDYFKTEHSYNAVLKNGGDIAIGVNLAKNTNGQKNNAIAYGNIFVFGAGDGVTTNNYAASLDVMAHEITHGVISSNSQLEYKNQSGALDESFADFFGAMVDSDDWHIGEDVFRREGVVMRNMANPADTNVSYPQPAHMSQFKFTDEDNGGVHINSGIINRALFLLAEGLTVENSGTSIGRQKTANIVFNTMISLSKNSSFDQATTAMIATAETLYPDSSSITESVADAFKQVGLPQDTYTTTTQTAYSPTLNAVVYLAPYNSPSDYGPTGAANNSYQVYVQQYYEQPARYLSSMDFGPLNTSEFSSLTRPTLIFLEDDSYRLIYKGKSTGKLFVYNSLEQSESELVLDGYTISDLSLSTDNETLIFTIEESPVIFVYNIESQMLNSYPVVGKTSSQLASGGAQASYVDTIRFDPTQRLVVFDYLTCGLAITSSECNISNTSAYWAIGMMEVASGEFFYPFPQQAPSIDVGFPSFSNKSDRYIVFDVINNNANTASGTFSGIYSFDTYVGGNLTYLGSTDYTTTGLGYYGTPSFTAGDTGVVFSQRTDDGSTFWHNALLDYQPIDNAFSIINDHNVYLPMSINSSSQNRVPSLSLSKTTLEYGDIRSGSKSEVELCAENSGNFPITFESFAAGNSAIRWTSNMQTLLGGQKVCGQVELNSGLYSSGVLNTTISVVHNGANSPQPISINAKFTLDTDYDGTIDSIDTDDDGDGLTDTQEATYGTNPLLKDSDSDGFSDYDEIADGTDPLDANSTPMGGLSLTLIKAFLDKQKAEQ